MNKKIVAILALILASVSFGYVDTNGKQNEDSKSVLEIESSVLSTTGNLSSGSACISSIGSTSRLVTTGAIYIYDQTNPAYITAGTTIAGLPGTCSAGQVQMSTTANHNATGDTITFGGQPNQALHTSKVWDDHNSQSLDTTLGFLAYLNAANNVFTGNVTATEFFGSGAGLTSVTGTLSGLTTNDILYASSATTAASSPNFVWDNTNYKLTLDGTNAPAGDAFSINSSPATVASKSLLALGPSDITGGSSSGTYIGVGASSTYSGDLMNLQVNSAQVMKVDSAGNMTPNSLQTLVANDATTGTTVNLLVKLTSSGKAVVLSTADISGILGVVSSGAGTSGSAYIAQAGLVSCVFDGATTAGDYVIPSITVAGDCHDFGNYVPPNQSVGRVLSTNGSGGTYSMIASNSFGSAASSAPIVAVYYASTNHAVSAGTQTPFDAKIIDTNNAVSNPSSTWTFTAPINTYYQVSVWANNANSGNAQLILYKNGSAYIEIAVASASNPQTGGTSFTIYANAGDTLDIRSTSSTFTVGGNTFPGTGSQSWIAIQSLTSSGSSANSWNGAFSSSTAFHRSSSSTQGDFTTSTSVSLSTLYSNNLSCVSHGSSIAGIDCTIGSTGPYLVCASGQIDINSGSTSINAWLTDGSSNIIQTMMGNNESNNISPFSGCGVYNVTSTGVNTFKIQEADSGSSTVNIETRGPGSPYALQFSVTSLGGGGSGGGSGLSGLTTNGVTFATSSSAIGTAAGSNQFTWDNTNNVLTLDATTQQTGDMLMLDNQPIASASKSVLAIGSDISGGNANGAGIGMNMNSGYTGDFERYQVNHVDQFRVDANGNIWIDGTEICTSSGCTSSGALSGLTTGNLTYATSGTSIGTPVNNLNWDNVNYLLTIDGNNAPAGDALSIPQSPAASGSNSLLSLGTTEVSGNSNGTYIGAVDPTGGPDFIDLQSNGNQAFLVDGLGNVTFGGSLNGQPGGNFSWDNVNQLLNLAQANAPTSDVIHIQAAPVASSSASLIAIKADINGGSANGTFIGGNYDVSSTYTGDFVDFQVNNVKKFVITGGGNVTATEFFGSGAGLTSVPGVLSGLTSTGVLFSTGASTASTGVNLEWDNTNYKLTIDATNGPVGDALSVNASPATVASKSLIALGSDISGGNASGTFIGANASGGYAGDLMNLQNNSVSQFKVGPDGSLSIGGIGVCNKNGCIGSGSNIVASYYESSTQTPGAATQINFDTQLIDTNSAVTTGAGAWKFTAPQNLIYWVGAYVQVTGGSGSSINLYKNGSSYATIAGINSSGSANSTTAFPIYLNTGDYIDLRTGSSVGIQGGAITSLSQGSYVAIYSLSSGGGGAANAWSGYFSTSTNFSISVSGSYADFTSSTNGTSLTTRYSNNLSCSAHGSNIPGVDCTIGQTGPYLVCASATAHTTAGSSNFTLQLTDGSGNAINSSGWFSQSYQANAILGGTLCGVYNVTSTGTNTFKLQAAGNTGGSPTVELEQFTANTPAEFSVTSLNAGAANITTNDGAHNYHTEEAHIANNGTCSITDQSGAWISSVSHTATGKCQLNFASGEFSAKPTCICAQDDSGNDNGACNPESGSSTSVVTYSHVNASSANDNNIQVICMGPH